MERWLGEERSVSLPMSNSLLGLTCLQSSLAINLFIFFPLTLLTAYQSLHRECVGLTVDLSVPKIRKCVFSYSPTPHPSFAFFTHSDFLAFQTSSTWAHSKVLKWQQVPVAVSTLGFVSHPSICSPLPYNQIIDSGQTTTYSTLSPQCNIQSWACNVWHTFPTAQLWKKGEILYRLTNTQSKRSNNERHQLVFCVFFFNSTNH